MARPGGLGKGLGALIPTGVAEPTGGLAELSIASIRPNPQQPQALSRQSRGVVATPQVAGGRLITHTLGRGIPVERFAWTPLVLRAGRA